MKDPTKGFDPSPSAMAPAYRTIKLGRDRAGVSIDIRVLAERHGQFDIQDVVEGGLLQIRQIVLSESFDAGKEVVRFEWLEHASWWDHFKATHFPKWLVKRFPCKTVKKSHEKRFDFSRRAVYPSLPCLPQFERLSEHGIINTVQEVPRCIDADVTGCTDAGFICSRLDAGFDEARGKWQEDVQFIAVRKETWERIVHALRRSNYIGPEYRPERLPDALPGVRTDVEARYRGVPVRFSCTVPRGLLRLVLWEHPRHCYID